MVVIATNDAKDDTPMSHPHMVPLLITEDLAATLDDLRATIDREDDDTVR